MKKIQWTGDLNIDEVVILTMAIDESIKGFTRTIKEVSDSLAMNLSSEDKAIVIANNESRISEYTALRKRFIK